MIFCQGPNMSMLDVLAIGLKLLAFLLKYGLSKCPNMGGGSANKKKY